MWASSTHGLDPTYWGGGGWWDEGAIVFESDDGRVGEGCIESGYNEGRHSCLSFSQRERGGKRGASSAVVSDSAGLDNRPRW